MSIQQLATGKRLIRWTSDESKLAGEAVEINIWDDNKFDILCQSESGMLRLFQKWQKSIKLQAIRTQFSANLQKWVLTVELN